MQKILTVLVPCYNSADYMRRAVESLLPGAEDLEILIVDDGSADATGSIAEAYAARFPDTVRVIRQANGGHGSAIMTGLREAGGLYFKVVDSDDWVETEALKKLLAALAEMRRKGTCADLVVTNYLYDHGDHGKRSLIHYRGTLPCGRIFSWQETGRFRTGSYFLMHAVTFRTDLLRRCGLQLPEHTFYVDNIFVYVPMAQVERLFYLDADLYHYCIGRPDQSVHESVMIRQLDQQLKINRIMLQSVDPDRIENRQKRDYLCYYLEIVTMATFSLLLISRTKENEQQAMDLLAEIRSRHPAVFRYLTSPPLFRHPVTAILKLPRWIVFPSVRLGYRIARKIYGFN